MKLGQYSDALRDCEVAVELDKKSVKGWWRMGICLRELGQLQKAKDCWETASVLEPGNRTVKKDLEELERALKGTPRPQELSVTGETPIFAGDVARGKGNDVFYPPIPSDTPSRGGVPVQVVERIEDVAFSPDEEQLRQAIWGHFSIGGNDGPLRNQPAPNTIRPVKTTMPRKKSVGEVPSRATPYEGGRNMACDKPAPEDASHGSDDAEARSHATRRPFPATEALREPSVATCPIPQPPVTFHEFERNLESLRGTPVRLCRYIESIPRERLRSLFGSHLEADHVMCMFRAYEAAGVSGDGLARGLLGVGRFGLVRLLLSDEDKEVLRKCVKDQQVLKGYGVRLDPLAGD